MKGIAEIIIGLLSLLEAEGIVFRANAIRLIRAALLQIIAFVFAGAALAFFVAAAYKWLSELISPPLTFCSLGGICVVIFLFLLRSSSAWRQTKQTDKKAPKSD